MLTLWALAIIMLAIQARASDIWTPPGNIFPQPGVHYVSIPSELHFNPPANGPLSRVSWRGSIPKGSPDRTSGAKCPPVAKYFLSSSKLDAYLNAILPQKIEKTLMCEEVNLAGVLGEAISTVSNSDLLSVLDITSLLSLSGGGGLGGILGKGTSSLDILGGGGLAGGLGSTLGKGTASLGILGGGGLVGGLGGTLSKGTASLGILGGGGLAGGLGGTLGKGTASLGILGGGGLAGGLSGGLGGGLGGILGKGTASLGILGGGGLAGGLSGGLGGGLGGILGKGTASLGILGGGGLAGGLGGILGQESGNKSPKYSAPLLSRGTDAVSDLTSISQEALGRPPLTSAEKNPVEEAIDSTGLLDSNKLKESTEGILNSVAPEGINNGLKSLLGNVNVENLLVGLKVEKVTVENMTSTMTDDGILVFAKTTAFIGGEGLAGPVIGILGFQVHSEVILKIGISTNNTQCVDLQVQDKDIKVKEVNMQLVKGITESLPVSLPLTLEDTVSQLLTVTMSKNIKESKSCDIELSDVNECKNSTGLFNYHVKSSRISAEGLSIFYCAHFRQNTSPVPGRLLPPDPKNANISLTFSGEMLKQIVAQSAKQSSVMMNNLSATITNVVYNHQPGNKIHVIYWVALKKDCRNFATGETELIVSHACKILKDKMRADVNIVSFKHNAAPPEAMVEVENVLSSVLKKLLSTVTENVNLWNIPPGPDSNSLNNVEVQVLKSKDFQAAN